MRHHAPANHGCQRLVDQTRAVLGADGGEIAPHLAPAMLAVLVLDADEHGRAIVHPAERSDDRRRKRVAVAKRLYFSDFEGIGHWWSFPAEQQNAGAGIPLRRRATRLRSAYAAL
jgi:hypothetical protein